MLNPSGLITLVSAFWQRATNTRHWLLGSLSALPCAPYHPNISRPAEPAAMAGMVAVLVAGPLLTRTGRDQCSAWSVE